jgi:hypothetical protein
MLRLDGPDRSAPVPSPPGTGLAVRALIRGPGRRCAAPTVGPRAQIAAMGGATLMPARMA